MSTTPGNTDSGLSGAPSADIDKQKGPATGSNVESPGGTLGTATQPASGNNPADQKAPSGTNTGSNAQQQSSGGTSH